MHDKRNEPMTTGQKLKRYRVERDLTFEALAKIINKGLPEQSRIHTSTLIRIENEAVEPNERTLYKIRKAIPEIFKGAA